MFRSRQPAGLLFRAQNVQKSEYLLLELRDHRIRFRYNLGSGEQYLTLSHVNVSDGEWHTVYIDRVGHWLTMRLDGGEGRNFNETVGQDAEHRTIRISQRSMIAGGDVRFPSSNSKALVDHDYFDSKYK